MISKDNDVEYSLDNDDLFESISSDDINDSHAADTDLDDDLQPPHIDILFEDEHIVAIHKPAGLLVHRSYLARRERFFAMQMTRDLVGCHVFPVHRLDRPTSGVLLFAKSSEVARLLCEQFADHSIKKHYLAIVRGNMHESGTLDYALKQEFDDLGDKHVDPNKAAQEAVTDYQPLLNTDIPFSSGRYPSSRYGLVRLSPQTGRKHQLRRHMAHLRHPIVGDTTHGDGKQNKFFREHFNINRLWLIAKSLQFMHPVTQQPMHIETELESQWLDIFTEFGWDDDQLSSMPSMLLS
ncbi:tRNA pseudouridine(65) synthase TruC [Shewanella livingstonensis]|uniref:tRNA pseudouridine synthase C n=1 Tax=Shewanella livingstonensis TaxID=150120 RepID=A0A3G8LVY5_9GAMM|nr:tRNA pseudouridine(65) synthase TruC [Shewanella livingstonensis]AZG73953.1 tRNA pseudouridine(65) synthase TruC [Shewanella livingstonensis]